MSEAQKHARDVAEMRRHKEIYEYDKRIGADLDNQNQRLEKLIKNYRLNKTWKRILWRMQLIEKLKRKKVAVAARFANVISKFKRQPQPLADSNGMFPPSTPVTP